MRHYYINSSSFLILSTLSCLKGGMAQPACAARALRSPLQPKRGAPARTTCPRRHSRVEAELAASRPRSVAASVRAGPPRGVSRGFNSQQFLDEPLKASSSLAGAARSPLFALLPRGRCRQMYDFRRRWDLGSLCRALLTRGLAALGHSLKHVLGAIFSKIFGPLVRYVLGESRTRAYGPRRAGAVRGGMAVARGREGRKFQLAHGYRARGLRRRAARVWLHCGSLSAIPWTLAAQHLRLQVGLPADFFLQGNSERPPPSSLEAASKVGNLVPARARLQGARGGSSLWQTGRRQRARQGDWRKKCRRVWWAKRDGDGSHGVTESRGKRAEAWAGGV